MKENKTRFWQRDVCIYVIFGIFYLWMAAQVPYTHDDWDWGLSNGIQQLITANLNSRYVGNFFVVIMTRSKFLKTVIMGAVYFAIPFIISHAAAAVYNGKSRQYREICFLVCNILLLTMDREIWQQTYGWVAGFANFSISSVIMMACIYEGLHVFEQNISTANESILRYIALFVLSLCGQLFLENLTLFMLLFYVGVSVVYYIRTRTISKKYMAMIAGALIGLLIMFSSSMYSTLLSTGTAVDGYRQLSFGTGAGIASKLYNFVFQALSLLPKLWENNLSICLCILLLLSCLLLQDKQHIRKPIHIILAVVNIFLCIYFIAIHTLSLSPRLLITLLANILFFVIVFVEVIFLFYRNKLYMFKLLTVWVSAPAIIMPLAVITESGPRLFFSSNAILILFAAMLLCEILEKSREPLRRNILKICLACAMLLVLYHGIVYHAIGACKTQREAIIADAIQNGAESIALPKFPYEEYLWIPDPRNEKRWEFFKAFYEIPNNVQIWIE